MSEKERASLVVNAGGASAAATLVEWWKPLDGDIESRGLRFDDDDSAVWLDKFELPGVLTAAGCRISDVIGTDGLDGLASAQAEAGYRVHIRAAPKDPHGRVVLAVWTDDGKMIGYLPLDVATEVVADSQRRGQKFSGVILREYRHADSMERTEIKLLIGPGQVWAAEAG